MTPPLRVLIADDHAPMRAGVRNVLEHGDCVVCAEAATAAAGIDGALRERPDVCLIDVRMPGSGIRAAAEITARLPDTAVVMLTMSSDTEDLLDAVNAGATGYLLKDMEPSRLVDAVRTAVAGEAPIHGRLTARLLEELRRRGPRAELTTADGHVANLTNREWDVIKLVADGLSTAQIAQRLFIGAVTVRRHISVLMRKTGVSSREELGQLLEEGTQPASRGSGSSRA